MNNTTSEFYVIVSDDLPLRFGSYCVATPVASPFLASVYGTRSKADAKMKSIARDGGVYIDHEKVPPMHIAVKRVRATVISIE